MRAMNVKGCPVSSSAGVMPQKTNGKQNMISNTFFQLLKSSNRIASTMKMVIGMYFIRFPIASPCNSPSPTQRIE